jgi:hypothetical protein
MMGPIAPVNNKTFTSESIMLKKCKSSLGAPMRYTSQRSAHARSELTQSISIEYTTKKGSVPLLMEMREIGRIALHGKAAASGNLGGFIHGQIGYLVLHRDRLHIESSNGDPFKQPRIIVVRDGKHEVVEEVICSRFQALQEGSKKPIGTPRTT